MSANRWDSKDPKDAKIMTLTTQVEQLLEAQKQYSAMVAEKNNGTNASAKPSPTNLGDFLSIKAWRMNKTEDSVQKEGRTWY